MSLDHFSRITKSWIETIEELAKRELPSVCHYGREEDPKSHVIVDGRNFVCTEGAADLESLEKSLVNIQAEFESFKEEVASQRSQRFKISIIRIFAFIFAMLLGAYFIN